MTDAGTASGHRRLRNVAVVVVPCVLTATAFGIASHFGLVGNLPFWMLLVLLALGGAQSQVTSSWLRPDASPRAMHAGLAAQVLSVTAIIYVIGWGATLTVGYVFVIARALDDGGSRVWRATLGWTIVGIALGSARGAAALTLYLLEGVSGLPVFASACFFVFLHKKTQALTFCFYLA